MACPRQAAASAARRSLLLLLRSLPLTLLALSLVLPPAIPVRAARTGLSPASQAAPAAGPRLRTSRSGCAPDLSRPCEEAALSAAGSAALPVATSALQTAANSSVVISPLFAGAAVAGVMWVISSVGHIAYDYNRHQALFAREAEGIKTLEEERDHTCMLLKSHYDGVRFQHHGIRVMVEALAGKPLTDLVADEDGGWWQSWRAMLEKTESNLMLLYNAFGGDKLCKEPVVMPEFVLMPKLATALQLPDDVMSASALLIVSGIHDDFNMAPRINFVSRLLEYLVGGGVTGLPRSGELRERDGSWGWWSLEPSTDDLVKFSKDGSRPRAVRLRVTDVVEAIADSSASSPEYCFKVIKPGSPPKVRVRLCAASNARRHEWISSLRSYICSLAATDARSTNGTVVRRAPCGDAQRDLYKALSTASWAKDSLPESWMVLPWRRRAIDMKLQLDCEKGQCRVKQSTPSPWRRSGILRWRAQGDRQAPERFMLLQADILSWYDRVGTVRPLGRVLIHEILIDTIQYTSSGACFSIMVKQNGKGVTYSGCPRNGKASYWVEGLRSAYANYFGIQMREGTLDIGGVLRTARFNQCSRGTWQLTDVSLYRDRIVANRSTRTTLLAGIIPGSEQWDFPISQLKDCQQKLPLGHDPTGNIGRYGKCFGFETDGVLWMPKEKIYFCGLFHLDEDSRSWESMLRPAISRFRALDANSIQPRENDVAWGVLLPDNPAESKMLPVLIDLLLRDLPLAQESGVAVLCPTGCKCPIYSRYLSLPDVQSIPHGFVEFEMRACGDSVAEIRGVKYRQDMIGPPLLELRLRSAVATPAAPSLSRPGSVANLQQAARLQSSGSGGNLRGRPASRTSSPARSRAGSSSSESSSRSTADRETPQAGTFVQPGQADQQTKTCDTSAMMDVLSFIVRVLYTQDGVFLSEKLPRTQHGISPQQMVVFVLQPLASKYYADIAHRIEGNTFRQSKDAWWAFQRCSNILFWKALEAVENEQLLLLETYGGASAQTEYQRNLNFHRFPLDSSSAAVVATEFWRSMNEHGCAATELWHPLEQSCIAFCERWGRTKSCTAKKQRWPGLSQCDLGSTAKSPSTGDCGRECRIIFPGHPGCELGDPSGMPEAAEDFYRETKADPLQIVKLAVWDAPRAVIPASFFFVDPTLMSQSLLHHSGWVPYTLDKIMGVSSAAAASQKVLFDFTTQAIVTGGMVSSVVFILMELWGIYTTKQNFESTSQYLSAAFKDKLKELQYVRCKLLGKLFHLNAKSLNAEDDDSAEMVRELKNRLEKYPDETTRFANAISGLPKQLCNGPLPAPLTKAECLSAFATLFDPSREQGASSATHIEVLRGIEQGLFGGLGPSSGSGIALSSDIEQCKSQFPPRNDRKFPLTSLQALWYDRLDNEDDENRQHWLRLLRQRSNLNFELLHEEGNPSNVDVKMGLTGKLETLFAAVRDPSSVPIIDIRVHHIARPLQWNSRAQDSVPSFSEYDFSIITSVSGQVPVSLALGGDCDRPDPDTQARCNQFSRRFKHGADYKDSMRAGGFVDLNMGCEAHWTKGFEVSTFGGGETEVFVSTKSGYSLPPIIEARLSRDPFDKSLAAVGFVRAQLDMNRECATSMLSEKSFLYYRRDWTMHPSWQTTIEQAEIATNQARECLSRAARINTGTQKSLRRILSCNVCGCPSDGPFPCKSVGLIDTVFDLGSDGDDKPLQRLRSIYLGEILVTRVLGTRDQGEVYACDAHRFGSLWTVTESLVKNAKVVPKVLARAKRAAVNPKAMLKKAIGAISHRFGTSQQDPVVPPLPVTPSDLQSKQRWMPTPSADDTFFAGAVQLFGDIELYEQNVEVPAREAQDLMCDRWNKLARRIKNGFLQEREHRLAEFTSCLSDTISDEDILSNPETAADKCSEALKHCMKSAPLNRQFVAGALEGNVCSTHEVLLNEVINAIERDVKENMLGQNKLFMQRKRGPFGGIYHTPREVTLFGREIVAYNPKNDLLRSFVLSTLTLSARLDFEEAPNEDGVIRGCFTFRGVEKETQEHEVVTLCEAIEEAQRWFAMMAQAILDATVGVNPAAADWSRAGLHLRCSAEQRVPLGQAHVEEHLLPDGYGHLFRLSPCKEAHGAERPCNFDEGLHSRQEEFGDFSRGIVSGIGMTRSADGLRIGHFQKGAFSFGTVVLRKADILASTSLRSAHKLLGQQSLYGGSQKTFTGYLLQTSDGNIWPAHAGTLRDGKSYRPIYWGQFALWLPWGYGIWYDPQTSVMFRGVLKKEYESFSMLTRVPTSRAFVPLMAGELIRGDRSTPIADDQVLKLGPSDIPSALDHAWRTMFGGGGSEPVKRQGHLEVQCRSKALFQWEHWLKALSSLVEVWTAISADTKFAYTIRVSALKEDPYTPGRNVQEILKQHTEHIIRLRKHLAALSNPQTPLGQHLSEADHRLSASVEVLAKAAEKGHKYNVSDGFWRQRLRNDPKLLMTAQRLKQLGPEAYMRFSSVADMKQAADEVLDFTTNSYCTLCFKPNMKQKRTKALPAELSVTLEQVRGLPVVQQQRKGVPNYEYAFVVIIQNERKDVEQFTEWQSGDEGSIRWPQDAFHFTGWQYRLEPSTKLKLQLRIREITKPLDPVGQVVGAWIAQLGSLVGRRGDFEWLTLKLTQERLGVEMPRLPEIRVAFSLMNFGTLVGEEFRLLPDGCGGDYAVQRLIEKNNVRLQRLEAEILRVDSMAADMAVSVEQRNFEQQPQLAHQALREKLVPRLDKDPPRASVEEGLHQDVFGFKREHGHIGGIHSTQDGASVELFRASEVADFFQKPEFFAEYIKLSNPAVFRK